MQVDIRLLGGFDVTVDGARVPEELWRRRPAATLVKYLALQPGRRAPRERVIDVLWPDLLLDEAGPRLHKAAHHARSILGSRDAVVLANGSVSLLPNAEVTVDVDLFDRAADAATRSGLRDLVHEAIDRYAGDLLPDDLYAEWAQEQREARKLRHAELLRRAGRWEEVVRADPTDEEAYLALIRERVAAGDRRGALRLFEQMTAALEQELGVGPSDEAMALRRDVHAMPATVGVPETFGEMTPVPTPATPTIGRDQDIAHALAALDRARVVTLLGPGGVGKTRLAVEVALRHTEAARVEACFVDLTKVDDPSAIAELVAREIGVRRSSQASAERLLREVLRGRSILLVLDNFEHVIEGAGLVADLVRWSPDVQVLTTSRARLQLRGEQVLDVAPLAVPDETDGSAGEGDAVALFEQAANAVDPRFRLQEHRSDVVAICRRLDGLPLAIELAAGHVRTLPPSLLRSRLDARLGSPSVAGPDTPSRQRTIPATIDWSLQLLGTEERRVFERLGVFVGSVPLEAVEAVCGEPGLDVVDALGRLVDQSLVRRVNGPRGEPRFTMLSLLREHARKLLAEADPFVTEELHARYIAGALDHIDEHRWTDVADRWIELIDEMLPDIRSAHAWAERCGDRVLAARITADLGTFWHREGHHPEARAWVADALAHSPELDEALVARVHLAGGFVHWVLDLDVARRHWSEAIETFRRLGDDRHLAYALALHSVTYVGDEDNYDVAVAECDEGIALARPRNEPPLLAQALNIKGELARVHGDDGLALAVYEEGVELATAVHDDAHLTLFLANLSYLADHRGDYEEAYRLGCEGLRLGWSRGRMMLAAFLISEIAGPLLGLGEPERGARLVGAADTALETLGVGRHPGDLSEHARVVAGLSQVLGEDVFADLRAEGTRLTLPEAVALALSVSEGRLTQKAPPRRTEVGHGARGGS